MLGDIVAEHGTPTYVYDAAVMRAQYTTLKSLCPDALIAYAVKSNTALAIIKLFGDLGAGVDIVSGGELEAALRAGINPARIVFSGVGKTDGEIAAGITADIGQFNVESASELWRIAAIAADQKTKARVAFRLNPDVGGAVFAKTTTGKKDNKFGILEEDLIALYVHAVENPALDVRGVSMHIGSQILDLEPFDSAFARLATFVRTLRAKGLPVYSVDGGGGLGISYEEGSPAPRVEDYAALVMRHIGSLGVQIILEPGRFLVGAAGVLLTRVVHIKESAQRRYVIIDAGMNTLIRPAMYDALHRIVPLVPRTGKAVSCDVVGPICESSDTFAKDYLLPPLEIGDILIIKDVGAHGACLASNYNTYPLPAEILVEGNTYTLIRARQTTQDLFARDRL